MKLSINGIKNTTDWEKAGIKLPSYDVEKVAEDTKKSPVWVHFGIGNIFRIRVFSSVAKNLSFTKASQELFISQPAITKHIQELETMYQTRLFERMGNKILLTDAGRLLLEHCEKILEDYGRLEYEMNLLRNEHTGELRLGASTTIAQ